MYQSPWIARLWERSQKDMTSYDGQFEKLVVTTDTSMWID